MDCVYLKDDIIQYMEKWRRCASIKEQMQILYKMFVCDARAVTRPPQHNSKCFSIYARGC